jgi:large subunit ribosomal protein L10
VSLTLEQKKRVVAEVNEIAAGAQAVIAAEYSGLSVSDMTELRVNARNDGVTIRVVKNSLGDRRYGSRMFE